MSHASPTLTHPPRFRRPSATPAATAGTPVDGALLAQAPDAVRATALAAAALAPEPVRPTLADPVTVDGRPAWRLRFVPAAPGRRFADELGGEHLSVVTAPDGALLGVTVMIAAGTEGPLPDRPTARAAADAFLAEAAPDLPPRREELWVEPHAETVTLADGGRYEIVGMKVKCRNRADRRYFWVIVGPGGRIQTFERDIVWNTLLRRRQTEQWLHDSWLADASA